MTTLSNPHRITCLCQNCIERAARIIEEAGQIPQEPKIVQQYKRSSDPRYWRRREK